MTVSPKEALRGVPFQADTQVGLGTFPVGNIGVGDFLIYSGSAIIPTAMGTVSQVKASAAGIAIDSNPVYDWYGASKTNTALRFVREGVFRVSANFSGRPNLGTPVYPASTGSGVYSPTGGTGVAATWNTAPPQASSGVTVASGVAYMINWYDPGNGGTGEMDILLPPHRPDYW